MTEPQPEDFEEYEDYIEALFEYMGFGRNRNN